MTTDNSVAPKQPVAPAPVCVSVSKNLVDAPLEHRHRTVVFDTNRLIGITPAFVNDFNYD